MDAETKQMFDRLQGQINVLKMRRAPVVSIRYTTAAAQSIPDTTPTILDYGTKVFDTHGAVTTGASWKFTAPVAGYYYVTAVAMFAASTTWALAENTQLRLYKNDAQYAIFQRLSGQDTSATSNALFVGGGDMVHLIVGEYVSVYISQTSGGALPLYNSDVFNYVSIFFIG